METKIYKRQDRSVSPETRAKISQSLRGRSKSFSHRAHIAQGEKRYWEQIPKQDNNDGEIGMDDIIL